MQQAGICLLQAFSHRQASRRAQVGSLSRQLDSSGCFDRRSQSIAICFTCRPVADQMSAGSDDDDVQGSGPCKSGTITTWGNFCPMPRARAAWLPPAGAPARGAAPAATHDAHRPGPARRRRSPAAHFGIEGTLTPNCAATEQIGSPSRCTRITRSRIGTGHGSGLQCGQNHFESHSYPERNPPEILSMTDTR